MLGEDSSFLVVPAKAGIQDKESRGAMGCLAIGPDNRRCCWARTGVTGRRLVVFNLILVVRTNHGTGSALNDIEGLFQ